MNMNNVIFVEFSDHNKNKTRKQKLPKKMLNKIQKLFHLSKKNNNGKDKIRPFKNIQ